MSKTKTKKANNFTITLLFLIVVFLPLVSCFSQTDINEKTDTPVIIPYRIDGKNTIPKDSDLKEIQPIKLINHKGCSLIAPENTLPAYRLSKQMGYSYVETDIHFTKDSVAVCLHDSNINRTARKINGDIPEKGIRISNITYEEALQYDFGSWKSEKYKGTKIPTFEQFIRLCRELHLFPYVEIKHGNLCTDTQLRSLEDTVMKYNMENAVTFIGFDCTCLEKLGVLCPASRLGILCKRPMHLDFRRICNMKTDTNEVFISSRLDCAEGIVEFCRAYQIPLEVWVVDSPKDYERLNPYISGVITNCL